MLTPFFGTCQKNEEEKECQIEGGDDARRKEIGHTDQASQSLWASFDTGRSRFGRRYFYLLK